MERVEIVAKEEIKATCILNERELEYLLISFTYKSSNSSAQYIFWEIKPLIREEIINNS